MKPKDQKNEVDQVSDFEALFAGGSRCHLADIL